MKRILFFLGSGLLLVSSAHAQLGVRAGGNLLNFNKSFTPRSGAASVNNSSQVGYQLGVYYQVPLTKRLSLVPEMSFSRERQQVHAGAYFSDGGFQSDYHLGVSYINLPVVLRLALGPVYLEAGPQASVLIGGRGEGITTYDGWTGTSQESVGQNATDRYQRFDAGFCLGVGVKLPAGLGVSLRAYQGLVQLNRTDQRQVNNLIPYSANDEYRQTLQASLTYQLHGG
jgi:hypothetical protein